MDSLHTCASLTVSSLPVATCTLLATGMYIVVLDTAITKKQILTLLEACLDLFNHKNA